VWDSTSAVTGAPLTVRLMLIAMNCLLLGSWHSLALFLPLRAARPAMVRFFNVATKSKAQDWRLRCYSRGWGLLLPAAQSFT
jgi:hypothetical protein